MSEICLARMDRLLSVIGAVTLTLASSATAQIPSSEIEADLVVEGRVQDIFEGQGSRKNVLVQILVERSEVSDIDRNDAGARFPAPGTFVYVHWERNDGRESTLSTARKLPQRDDFVRAQLNIGRWGRWEGSIKPARKGSRTGPVSAERGTIGITSERVALGLTGNGLKVRTVEPNSSAAGAGIEVGDVLIKANGRPIADQNELDAAFRQSRGSLKVTVRDVRSGREVDVNVSTTPIRSEDPRQRTPQPLGVTTELAFVGGNEAIKVIAVEPNSPAARAGIAPGLLILKANGNVISRPDDLSDADRGRRDPLILEIFDPNTKRQREITIQR